MCLSTVKESVLEDKIRCCACCCVPCECGGIIYLFLPLDSGVRVFKCEIQEPVQERVENLIVELADEMKIIVGGIEFDRDEFKDVW